MSVVAFAVDREFNETRECETNASVMQVLRHSENITFKKILRKRFSVASLIRILSLQLEPLFFVDYRHSVGFTPVIEALDHFAPAVTTCKI